MEGQEKVRGRVTRIFYANMDTGWMAGTLADGNGARVSFAGSACADVGDTVTLFGEWTQTKKYGRQLDVKRCVTEIEETPDALVRMLASREEFKGIGDARANAIVTAALEIAPGEPLADVLKDNAEEIADVAHVHPDLVRKASVVWSERRDFFDAIAALTGQGWTGAQSNKLVKRFGVQAPAVVKKDPYMIVGKIERFGFRTVDTIALNLGIRCNDPERLKAGVAFCLDRETSNGHTWASREQLLGLARAELQLDTIETEDAIEDALDDLVRVGLVEANESPSDGAEMLSPKRLATVEQQVFDRLIGGLCDDSSPLFDESHYPAAFTATLNEGQRSALDGVAKFRCSVLSGAAGTGKTYTMHAIVEAAEAVGHVVALCAPTGKAAKKLANATAREAKTIHRLLEPAPDMETGGFYFKRNSGDPLDADLVIVDECSMCDVPLMGKLLDAIKDGAHLLLVGDHNQIPSVGAGAILRDILSAGARAFPGAIHVLDRVVRQAGELAKNTTAILGGVVVPNTSPSWGIHRTDKGGAGGTPGIVSRLVEALVTSPEPLEPFGRLLDPAWGIQVISPMRKGPHGVYALNVELQRLRQRLLGNVPPPPTPENKQPKPLVGDRVIWTKNDYGLMMFNGTQAIVKEIQKGGTMLLLTEDDREVEVENKKRALVELAYALTIHKCQGSEWPCVILVCSSGHYIMHDRNLLYTGASRASESLTIVGDWKGIRSFATQRKSEERRTLGLFMVKGWAPRSNAPKAQEVSL